VAIEQIDDGKRKGGQLVPLRTGFSVCLQ